MAGETMMTHLETLTTDPTFIQRVHSGESGPSIHRNYVAEKFGCSGPTTRRARSIVLGKPHSCLQSKAADSDSPPTAPQPTSFTQHPNGTATAIGPAMVRPATFRVMSLDDLLTICDVDRDRWEVKDYKVNKWESGNAEGEITQLFQVKASLIPIVGGDRVRAMREEITELVRLGAPKYAKQKRERTKGSERYLFEMSMADLHIGKYAWSEEVGADYDTDIASQRFSAALESLSQKASGFPVDRILYVVGNDLLQIDNERNETTRGTRQDTDTRYKKVFRVACELQILAVQRLMEIAPVDVVVVPGNHDQLAAFHVGEFLDAWFRYCDDVTVDNGANLRKYYRYGKNLIGLTHGNEERHADLPLIMAQERASDWAETISREWHCGHMHKRKQTKYVAGDTHNGVSVRILPSLSGTDWWHHSRGYVGGMKAAEAYLHEFNTGYAGHFSYNLTEK